MLSGYRKRFVAFNLLVVGVVLLIALTVQGVYLRQSSYREMQETMRMVLEPWGVSEDTGELQELIGRKNKNRDAGRPDGTLPEQREGRPGKEDRQVLAVIYDPESGDLSVLSRFPVEDTDALLALAEEAAASDCDAGRLSDGTYFLREGSAGSYRIAFAEPDYLSTRLTRNILVLAAVFVGAMGLVLLASVRLSRLAAKPMEDAITMERQFIADLSHDLKTPITVVLANTSILKSSSEASAAEREQWLDSTEDASRSMMHMVEEMLTLSELEAPGRTLTLLPADLSSAAEKAVLQLEPLAFERGVTLSSEIDPDVSVPGAEDYLQRICSSLTENAIKYEPDGGRVELRLRAAKNRAVLTVRNATGLIAPEDLPHIFERFYRGDKARSGKQGHGLGLSIVRELTEKLGARITAESSPEQGTCFTVTFDLA